eukprot:XP_011444260.1 PREDICTED: uncharacterized protein LOC105340102 [Crassostrea gigas]
MCVAKDTKTYQESAQKSSVRTINSENSVQRTALASKATMRDVTSVVHACVPQDGLVRTVPKKPLKIFRRSPLAVTALEPTPIILRFQTMDASLCLVSVSMKAKSGQKIVRMTKLAT